MKEKISIIGAGKVGTTLAMRVAENNLGDVFLLDIDKSLTRGKVLDLQDSLAILNCSSKIKCCEEDREIKDSHIIVITAGFFRQPNMSRENLLDKNKEIVKEIVPKIKKHSPQAIIIIITNPLDIMTYLAYKLSSFPRQRVIGMSGVLDSGRFCSLVAEELNLSPVNIKSIILGMHSDLMLPLLRYTTVCGVPISQLLSNNKIEELIKKTKNRGGEIVSCLGSSAYYSPSAAAFLMLKAIINDEAMVMPACVYLDGEYGLKDICLGVPVKVGRKGAEKIIDLGLNGEEKRLLNESAEKVRKGIEIIENFYITHFKRRLKCVM